jgi:hypothetical protein
LPGILQYANESHQSKTKQLKQEKKFKTEWIYKVKEIFQMKIDNGGNTTGRKMKL